jgi:hypothetical protein
VQARITVVDMLKEKGLFRGVADNPMRLGLCSRSKAGLRTHTCCRLAAQAAATALSWDPATSQPRALS